MTGRRVQQLQFTAWPDHGVPETPSSLVKFAELVQKQIQAAPRLVPTLVHCSAGVGRTGTFVALLRLLRQLREEHMVDVFYVVYALRQSRPLMIQTLVQYIFLHSCLLDKIMEESAGSLVSWTIIVKNFSQNYAKRSAHCNAGFLREYELLQQAFRDQDNTAPHHLSRATPQLLSYERWRVNFPLENSSIEPVQAWFFPGEAFVRDQIALVGPAKIKEFWHLVWEHGARVLVSLCPLDTQNKKWWPVVEHPIHIEALTVHWVAQRDVEGWLSLHLRVKHEKKEKELKVKLLQFPYWESGQEPPAWVLLSFLEAVGQHYSRIKRRKPKTMLAYSRTGRVQLGIFLAMDQLLQQAKFRGSVDIFGVVLHLAKACDSMMPTLEQYIYLYECVGSALANGLI